MTVIYPAGTLVSTQRFLWLYLVAPPSSLLTTRNLLVWGIWLEDHKWHLQPGHTAHFCPDNTQYQSRILFGQLKRLHTLCPARPSSTQLLLLHGLGLDYGRIGGICVCVYYVHIFVNAYILRQLFIYSVAVIIYILHGINIVV